jgi:hypothetical protein
MTQDELKLVLDALEDRASLMKWQKARDAVKEALAQTQEPVAWLITDEKINSLQVDSIQRLIDRARHAHMTDIKLRINGQDEWHQADWLKHLTRTTPPQLEERNFCSRCGKRTKDIHTCTPPQRSESSGKPSAWVGLTEQERNDIEDYCEMMIGKPAFDAIEAKLKEKNT